jgi:hypothetical protein
VEKTGLADGFTTLAVTLVETSQELYAFDPATDEKPFQLDVKA